jgi:hypothetical protein
VEKIDFLTLMSFPLEWAELDMYPDELFYRQLEGYEKGHEESSEHDRNGAFHWWLKQNPSKKVLTKLVILARLDPDPFLKKDILEYIKKSNYFDREIENLMR